MHSHPSAVKQDFTVDSSLKKRRLNPDTEMKKKVLICFEIQVVAYLNIVDCMF